jgi:large-conductance mechanosensitive channel
MKQLKILLISFITAITLTILSGFVLVADYRSCDSPIGEMHSITFNECISDSAYYGFPLPYKFVNPTNDTSLKASNFVEDIVIDFLVIYLVLFMIISLSNKNKRK